MEKRIIDLRDAPLPTLPYRSRRCPTCEAEAHMGRCPKSVMPRSAGNIGSATPQLRERERFLPLIEWTAPEYPARERGSYWWLPPSAAALAAVLFAIVVRSYVFAAFAAIALATALLYARRAPREYRFAISREGVYIGETRHRFSELVSFWIFEHPEGAELSLETASGRVFPHIHLPLGDVHPNRIRRALSDFLPEQEHKELFTDQIARSIGF